MSIDGDGGCDLFRVWHMCMCLFTFVREGMVVVCHSA
jgi:hypothetical protein